jgi:surface antigen
MTLQKNCREFTVQVTIEGQPRQAVGQACRSLMELAGHVGYVWLAQQI